MRLEREADEHAQPATSAVPAVLHQDALASIPRALTALIYTHDSLPAARAFADAFFLSRTVDLRALPWPRLERLELAHCPSVTGAALCELARRRPALRALEVWSCLAVGAEARREVEAVLAEHTGQV